MAKSSPRQEWNGLPGYLAAERLFGASPQARFNALDLGIDAKTLEEFIATPVEAIEEILFKRGVKAGPQGHFRAKTFDDQETDRHLYDLFFKVANVLVMAERQRVEAEVAQLGKEVRDRLEEREAKDDG